MYIIFQNFLENLSGIFPDISSKDLQNIQLKDSFVDPPGPLHGGAPEVAFAIFSKGLRDFFPKISEKNELLR